MRKITKTIRYIKLIPVFPNSGRDRFLKNEIHNIKTTIVEKKDYLINDAAVYPVYLKKGVKLYIDQSMQGNKTTNFYNADTKKLLKSYKAKKGMM